MAVAIEEAEAIVVAESAPPEPLAAQPRRPERVDIGGEWPGWWVEVDADVTWGQLDMLWAGKPQQVRDAFTGMLLGWNVRDKRGEPIPATADGMREVGFALFWACVRAVRDHLARPKAQKATSSAGSGATANAPKASTPTT